MDASVDSSRTEARQSSCACGRSGSLARHPESRSRARHPESRSDERIAIHPRLF